MDYCVSAIDGWLCRIKTPAITQTGNVKAYFSGHYKAPGINVQAACMHILDSNMYLVSVLVQHQIGLLIQYLIYLLTFEGLSDEYFAIGDCAYIASESMLVPYQGSQKDNTYKDSFNFHLSQCRIRIEQAFGLMTTKWGILQKPLRVQLKNVAKVILCITRLHNYTINERLSIDNTVCPMESEIIKPFFIDRDGTEKGYIPTQRSYDQPKAVIGVQVISGISVRRYNIVRNLSNNTIVRPTYNKERNKKRKHNNI